MRTRTEPEPPARCRNGHTAERDRRGRCRQCTHDNALRWRTRHPEKHREYTIRSRAKHPGRVRATRLRWAAENRELCRKKWLRGRYRLSRQQLNDLLARENCDACGQPFGGDSYHHTLARQIDHCHKTGRVRGVLHRGCNVALGYAGEDPGTLRAIAAYAERVAE